MYVVPHTFLPDNTLLCVSIFASSWAYEGHHLDYIKHRIGDIKY